MAPAIHHGIDLERYPLGEPSSARYCEAVEMARRELAETGAASIPGFVHATGIEELRRDAEALSARAFHSVGTGTAFLGAPGRDVDVLHPSARQMPFAVSVVAYDAISEASPLRQLYEDEAVLDFIAAIVDVGPLYRYADPFGALNLAVMADGDELQWHYDQTDFVVSLAIQAADHGGDFEVVPKLRERSDDDAAAERAVLDGDRSDVVCLAMEPGTLLVFKGRTSLHRVSPIAGEQLRYVGLLAYDTEPDRVGTEALRATRYGRTIPFPSPPKHWPEESHE